MKNLLVHKLATGVVATICLLVLTACATLNKDECLNANWQILGYEDGAKGYPLSHIALHRKACAKHGVQPDLKAYSDGHQRGVREFCTPQRGYQRGSQGVHYLGVCPPDLEPAFLEAYQLGQTVYRLEKEIKDSKRSLKSLYDEVDSIEQTIVDLKHKLVHEGHNPRKRRQLLRDIRIQEDQKAELLDQINAQENQLDALNRKLARLEGNRP